MPKTIYTIIDQYGHRTILSDPDLAEQASRAGARVTAQTQP